MAGFVLPLFTASFIEIMDAADNRRHGDPIVLP